MTKEDRHWPAYIVGGRVRTSTVALILAFVLVWWLYQEYKPTPPPVQAPATQVVPPGFVPDPNYTWVPRTNVEAPRRTATTTTTTTTTAPTTTETTSPTESTTPSETTSGSPTTSPTTTTTSPTSTTPPPPGAPPTPPSSAAPGRGPSPTPPS